MILQQAREHYGKVIAYHDATRYDTRLDVIWTHNMSDIAKIVMSSGSAEELIDKVDQTYMYSINFPPENGENTGVWRRNGDSPHIREKQINWLLQKQLQAGVDLFSMPEYVQESKYIHTRNKTIRRGRVLSGNFLRTLSIAAQVAKHVGKVSSVLELGGGCGHQARTLSLLNPCKYTIVDLPETLLFSFTYISLNFPGKRLKYVTHPDELSDIDDYDFVFIPAVFANRLAGKSYDLFINTASMGEMRNDVIHYWMDLIQNKLNIKFLFTLNRFLNTIDGPNTYRANENECSTSYDCNWDMLNWELEPLYARCPYIDTLHSRYMEIIDRRNSVQENLVERGVALLQDALDEDWYRLKGHYGNGVGQARTNVLVNDMTMTGTLFKLWESIRLNRTANNISAMIEYLGRITINKPFEEMSYYKRL